MKNERFTGKDITRFAEVAGIALLATILSSGCTIRPSTTTLPTPAETTAATPEILPASTISIFDIVKQKNATPTALAATPTIAHPMLTSASLSGQNCHSIFTFHEQDGKNYQIPQANAIPGTTVIGAKNNSTEKNKVLRCKDEQFAENGGWEIIAETSETPLTPLSSLCYGTDENTNLVAVPPNTNVPVVGQEGTYVCLQPDPSEKSDWVLLKSKVASPSTTPAKNDALPQETPVPQPITVSEKVADQNGICNTSSPDCIYVSPGGTKFQLHSDFKLYIDLKKMHKVLDEICKNPLLFASEIDVYYINQPLYGILGEQIHGKAYPLLLGVEDKGIDISTSQGTWKANDVTVHELTHACLWTISEVEPIEEQDKYLQNPIIFINYKN